MRVSIASPLIQPSPNGRRVGIRIVTFEACSGFTHVTARRIAQPPKAAFVTRLQPCRLPDRTARQLPDQSTTLWVESSSTSDPRLRGALPTSDIPHADRLNKSCPSAALNSILSSGDQAAVKAGFGFRRWPRSRTMISKGPRLPGFFCPPQPGTSHPCKDRSPLPCAILCRL